jgi:hypothetical protein
MLESTCVDTTARVMTTHTVNITHTTILVVDERQVISCSDEDGKTRVETTTEVTSNLSWFLRGRVEAFGVARFQKNVVKSRKGLEWVLDLMKEDAVSGTQKRNGLAKGLQERVEKAKERVGGNLDKAADNVP